MNFTQSLFYQRLLTGTLVAVFSSAIGLPLISLKAQAQGFGTPPGSSTAGGVRGECFVADPQRKLSALVLVDESDPAARTTEEPAALTTQENPTLLFYLPFGQPASGSANTQHSIATTAEFKLQDENGNSVLKSEKITLSIPKEPGIVSLKIPSSEVRLEPNKAYKWIFRVICDPNQTSANPSVRGWIKRVNSGSSKNVWYDYLDQMIQSRTNDLENWKKILGNFNISDLAQSPITELKPITN